MKSNKNGHEQFRRIPAVDQLLSTPETLLLCSEYPREAVVGELRRQLQRIRQLLRKGAVGEGELASVLGGIPNNLRLGLEKRFLPSLRKLINATGVVLHTNLGRAPLSSAALDRVREVAAGYSNLEFDLTKNARGKRDVHAEHFLKELLRCEAVLVVNNCAAAVLLVLNTLAEGREVIVSRGELVEIGGSFRVPDIMRKSGALLHEVGTTNRTRLGDYSRAINTRTQLILRVHRSNFRLVGFSEQPSLVSLAKLAHRHRLPVLEDLGSGCVADLAAAGIQDEPTVQASLKAGVDIITFSGDKLLGGPQSGIIIGRKKYLELIRENPLYRALRVDKLTLAALEATLLSYLRRDEKKSIPSLRMIIAAKQEIADRARDMVHRVENLFSTKANISLEVVDGVSVIGGGSTPGQEIRTALISITSNTRSAQSIEKHFRMQTIPILVRVENKQVLLDLRTVLPEEEEMLFRALSALVEATR